MDALKLYDLLAYGSDIEFENCLAFPKLMIAVNNSIPIGLTTKRTMNNYLKRRGVDLDELCPPTES